MPDLPLDAWIAVGTVAAILLGLVGGIAYAVLRAPVRRRTAAWPPRAIVGAVVAAGVPWLVVWLAPIDVRVSIHSLAPLLGWLLVALLAFAALVLLPVAALLTAGAWVVARRPAARGAPGAG